MPFTGVRKTDVGFCYDAVALSSELHKNTSQGPFALSPRNLH